MKTKKNWDKIHKEASAWARWMSLFEAVNIIADKAEEKGISFQKVEIKPLAIHKYMEMTENIFLRKILKQEYNIDLFFEELEENFEKKSISKEIKVY